MPITNALLPGAVSGRARVAALARALYAELGAAAPGFSADGAVVRAYEAARAFGELAQAAEAGGAPGGADPALALVLAEAARADPTGWLALYDLAAVVGPRLLARFAPGEASGEDAVLLESASDLVSAEIVATRAALPADGDAAAWRAASRAAAEALDAAGLGAPAP